MTDRAKSDQETWWVLRAQSGDREALNELLKNIQEPLYLSSSSRKIRVHSISFLKQIIEFRK